MENLSTDAQIHANSLRRGLAFFLIFFSFCFAIQAQVEPNTSDKKARKFYFKSIDAQKARDFDLTFEYLDKAIERDPKFTDAILRKSNLLFNLGELDSAYGSYKSYLSLESTPNHFTLERFVLLAFDRGEYLFSEKYLDQLLAVQSNALDDPKLNLVQESLEFVKKELLNSDSTSQLLMPKEINRYRLQYLPVQTIDGKKMYYTKRDQVSGDEDIVVSQKVDGIWQTPQSVSDRINSRLNEGACTVSADGRFMIFTSCDKRDSYGSCDLYSSMKVGDFWSRPKNLGKQINTKYWESQPSLSADGRRIYFSSTRPGGVGARDIWYSDFSEGNWGRPVNLKLVNSILDETTPFIHFNGVDFYFASNGYPGMGGFDLFRYELSDSAAKPQNLGSAINSHRDEVALSINAAGNSAFLAKEKQKNREITESNIYRVILPENDRPQTAYYVHGSVRDSKTENPLKAEVSVLDIETRELLYKSQSDSISGEYFLTLPQNRRLIAYVKKRGYLFQDFPFDSKVNEITDPDSIDIFLKPIELGESIELRNVFFEFNSSLLSDESIVEIESVINFLSNNPRVHIRIEGHTDQIGSASYNLNLSVDRAKAVYSELIKAGISKERLNFKGFGMSSPKYKKVEGSTNQSNRRIEFRVLRSN